MSVAKESLFQEKESPCLIHCAQVYLFTAAIRLKKGRIEGLTLKSIDQVALLVNFWSAAKSDQCRHNVTFLNLIVGALSRRIQKGGKLFCRHNTTSALDISSDLQNT